MSPPPLLLGAGLIFWGWQTGFLLVALPLAVLIEAARSLTWRLDLSSTDFHRVTDLCTLLIVVAGVYLFSTTGTSRTAGGPRNGEVIFSTDDWQHPPSVSFATPIVLTAGQGLTSEVTYRGDATRTIRFGLTSEDEMGIIAGYWY